MFRKVLLGTACLGLVLVSLAGKVSAQVPNADSVSVPGGTSMQTEFNYIFNGSSWDRVRNPAGSPGANAIGVTTIQSYEGFLSSLNVAVATTVKAASGRLFKISVTVAGSAAGQACDVNGACSAANVVAAIPNVVGVYELNWPMFLGVRIEPGTGQTVSVVYQ